MGIEQRPATDSRHAHRQHGPDPVSAAHHPALSRRSGRELYDALFCDALPATGAFAASTGRIYSQTPAGLHRILDDPESESRLRLLAASELRRRGHPTGVRKTLGVIVEVALDEGLNVLAAYADGQVRYIAATGGVLAFENAPPRISFLGRSLVATAHSIVPLIAPNSSARGAPPEPGLARLTLLTGQGRFTGDGPLEALRNDGLAGPLIEAAQALLEAICDAFSPRSHAMDPAPSTSVP